MSPLYGLIFACCQMLGHISQLLYPNQQNFELAKMKNPVWGWSGSIKNHKICMECVVK